MSNLLKLLFLTIIFFLFLAILSPSLYYGRWLPVNPILYGRLVDCPHIKPISAGAAGILPWLPLIINSCGSLVGFETDLMVNGFKQAQTNIGWNKRLLLNKELSRLEFLEGTSLMGRFGSLCGANTALQEALPEANINARRPSKPMTSCSITVRTRRC